jgi:prepilin-type N-terminal cleavage/methylation domain-containing protein
MLRLSDRRGFTLIELMIVVGIIAILTAIAIPLFGSTQTRARIAKAQADLKTLSDALIAFGTHCGDVPATGWPGAPGGPTCGTPGTGPGALTVVIADANNLAMGPLLPTVPPTPPGWIYTYTRTGVGRFVLQANGDGTTITLP